MPRQIELMAAREERIGDLLDQIREKSRSWKKPPLVVIGGYALRAHIPLLSRYSRDCNFALPKSRGWEIDRIEIWFPGIAVESKEKKDGHGHLRLIELLRVGRRSVKISLDFMEGEIRGRHGEAFFIDDEFIARSSTAEIPGGQGRVQVRVPEFEDYFLVKVLSGRASDVRDVAAMIWKKGVPEAKKLARRAKSAIRGPEILQEKLDLMIRDVSDGRFVDSWRGTFITGEFAEADKKRVLSALKSIRQEFNRF